MYAQKEKHTTEKVTMTVDARKKCFTPPGIIQSMIHHWEIQSYSTGKTADPSFPAIFTPCQHLP